MEGNWRAALVCDSWERSNLVCGGSYPDIARWIIVARIGGLAEFSFSVFFLSLWLGV